MKPRIFIGSSKEGLAVARELRGLLLGVGDCNLWNKDIFEASGNTQTSLIKGIQDSDYVVIVLTADDSSNSRGSKYFTPRDNLIFEAGLGFGLLAPERTFLVPENVKKLKIPSDLAGFTLTRGFINDGKINKGLADAANQIKKRIEDLGCKSIYRIRAGKSFVEKASIELIESADRHIMMFGRDLSWVDKYANSLEKKINEGVIVEVFAEHPKSNIAKNSTKMLEDIGARIYYSERDHGIKLTLIDYQEKNCSRFIMAFKERKNIGARSEYIYHCEIHNANDSWILWNTFIRLYESLKKGNAK